MNQKILIAIFAALCIGQVAIADRANTGSDTLDEIINKSGEVFQSLHKGFLDWTNSDSDAELIQKIQDSFKTAGDTLTQQLKDLKEETKSQSGKAADYYRDFQNKLNKNLEEFKSNHPDIKNNAKAFQEGVEKRYNLVVDEARTLKEKLKGDGSKLSDKSQRLLNDIVEGTVDNAKSMKLQLEEAAQSPRNWTMILSPVVIILLIYVYKDKFLHKKVPEKVQ